MIIIPDDFENTVLKNSYKEGKKLIKSNKLNHENTNRILK